MPFWVFTTHFVKLTVLTHKCPSPQLMLLSTQTVINLQNSHDNLSLLQDMRSSATKEFCKSLSPSVETPFRSSWKISSQNMLKQSPQLDEWHSEPQLSVDPSLLLFSVQLLYLCATVLSASCHLHLCRIVFVDSVC